MAIPSRSEIDAMIRSRIAADPQFRAKLLADPNGALGELVGVEIPAAVTVSVHEESLTEIHLVLPAGTPTGELSESDLELVAGGGSCWDNCGCSI